MIPVGVVALVVVATALFSVMIVAAAIKGVTRGATRPSTPDAGQIDERLQRIERVLDHVAQEVEVMSEGQRFLSNRLLKRVDDRA